MKMDEEVEGGGQTHVSDTPSLPSAMIDRDFDDSDFNGNLDGDYDADQEAVEEGQASTAIDDQDQAIDNFITDIREVPGCECEREPRRQRQRVSARIGPSQSARQTRRARRPASQTIVGEELGEIGAMYTVRDREGARLGVFAASLNPELLKAFKAEQRSKRCKVRGLRRSPRLRGSTTRRQPGEGWRKGWAGGERYHFPYEGILSSAASIYLQ